MKSGMWLMMDEPALFRADLHCHTHFSDGSDAPVKLIQLAKEIGLSGLSITDHDTIDAYADIGPLTHQDGFRLLPGVEFSASWKEEPIHILGYSFALDSPSLQNLSLRHHKRRSERNTRILWNLKKLGIRIEEEEIALSSSKVIGRPHIALALMNKGIVKSIKEAFDRFLGEGKLAYFQGEPISVEETIDAIHKGRGIAILAHPHLIKRQNALRAVLEMPLDGLEGYYARFSPDQEKKWITLASKKGWIVTGGSDYHGINKPMNILGSSWVGKETFERLYEHYLASST